MKWLLLITAFFFVSCGVTKQITEIKPKVIHPPVIEDSIKVVTKTDTVVVGVDVIKKDTITVVKYFPKYEKFFVKVKPDSIVIMDTVRIIPPAEIIETPLLSKLGLIFLGMLIVVIGYLFIKR